MSKGAKKLEVKYSDFVIGVNIRNGIVPVSHPPATEEEILEMERTIGESLPSEYREFMKCVNGGAVSPNVAEDVCFNVESPLLGDATPLDESYLLGYLFTLSVETLEKHGLSDALTFSRGYKAFLATDVDWPHMPEDFIPIGYAGVSTILLGIRGEHRGKVVLYEYVDVDEALKNVFLIADNFDRFLDSLFPCEPL